MKHTCCNQRIARAIAQLVGFNLGGIFEEKIGTNVDKDGITFERYKPEGHRPWSTGALSLPKLQLLPCHNLLRTRQTASRSKFARKDKDLKPARSWKHGY